MISFHVLYFLLHTITCMGYTSLLFVVMFAVFPQWLTNHQIDLVGKDKKIHANITSHRDCTVRRTWQSWGTQTWPNWPLPWFPWEVQLSNDNAMAVTPIWIKKTQEKDTKRQLITKLNQMSSWVGIGHSQNSKTSYRMPRRWRASFCPVQYAKFMWLNSWKWDQLKKNRF